jgi:ABC-type phosphate transport system substrate-binding protein
MGNRKVIKVAALLGSVACLLAVAPVPVSAGPSTTEITGSGSSWAYNAVNQWIADVQNQGLQVVFTPTGSAQGRQEYAGRTVDFAVSDIGYQGHDPLTGADDTSDGRSFAYVPIVAGGTSFPYQIRVRGQLVTNLRLSGLTLAKIFTNQITNWDDPEITADNNGRQLPSIPIIPVVHSEGAGTTAQFTAWLAAEYPSLWAPYSGRDVMTEYWPRKGGQIAQDGSDGVMNFLTSSAGNGSIGIDEYSYALADNLPAAKIENKNGYFTLPTMYNVAVALTQAQINTNPSSPDYLLETLNNVYTYGDPRTYPLSSYSYLIEPTASNDSTMSTSKRQTLVNWMSYSLCSGQAEIGPIGYSALPVNLVEAAYQQIGKQHTADPSVQLTGLNITNCHNPTFDPSNPNLNFLAQIAPLPPSCDHAGQGPCTGNQGTFNGNPVNGQATVGPQITAGSGSGGSGSGSGGAGSGGTSSSGASSGGRTLAAGTGQSSGGSSVGLNESSNGSSTTQPPVLNAAISLHDNSPGTVIAAIGEVGAVVLLLALSLVPALVVRSRRSRGEP